MGEKLSWEKSELTRKGEETLHTGHRTHRGKVFVFVFEENSKQA